MHCGGGGGGGGLLVTCIAGLQSSLLGMLFMSYSMGMASLLLFSIDNLCVSPDYG